MEISAPRCDILEILVQRNESISQRTNAIRQRNGVQRIRPRVAFQRYYCSRRYHRHRGIFLSLHNDIERATSIIPDESIRGVPVGEAAKTKP